MTIYLGRLLGLYLIVMSVAMMAGRRRTLATLGEMAQSGPWRLFSGMVATAVGLAVTVAHNVWSGGALSVAVTLLGWAALLKGLALLIAPSSAVVAVYKAAKFDRYFIFWMSAVLALGLWMLWEAFTG